MKLKLHVCHVSHVSNITHTITLQWYFIKQKSASKDLQNHANTMKDHKWASKNTISLLTLPICTKIQCSKLYPFFFLLSRESQKCNFSICFPPSSQTILFLFDKVIVLRCVERKKICFYYATSWCNIVFFPLVTRVVFCCHAAINECFSNLNNLYKYFQRCQLVQLLYFQIKSSRI